LTGKDDDDNGIEQTKKISDKPIKLEQEPPYIPGENLTDVPVFALMYKFRPEYNEKFPKEAAREHERYAKTFRRLLSDEEIRLDDARGRVLLWCAKHENDIEFTKIDIADFVERDPLMVSKYIQEWDLLELFGPELDDMNYPSDQETRKAAARPFKNTINKYFKY